MENSKPVIYQVFTRLFGNTISANKPWGTRQENGVGKFNDFTDTALQAIKELGVTHIWFTGVPHHALIGDYSDFGISDDDTDVVKGRAGSPYAVKDYYNVNPDLAVDVSHRLDEFKALIDRTHRRGMKVIIDIVPNHVARAYHSVSNPEGVEDFGASDNTSVEFARDNNFYYIPGQAFQVPESRDGYQPLGGEPHPQSDGFFDENPAKWTGNGSRMARPDFYDWYETVKINYGVRPDGSADFDLLPQEYTQKTAAEHLVFWQERSVPDSWEKFRDIALYWIQMGVDGFRYDMAELVPVEFWSYMNSSIKVANPDAFLMAEVYNPSLYRDYIYRGKMDYLYDKVGLYDSLRAIITGHDTADSLPHCQHEVHDIEPHMVRFLENHDEQRIASRAFAGYPEKALPAMTVTATLGNSPVMIYFAQELGEPANDNAGFGSETRTTIFDYWGIASLQRWYNGGACDGGHSTDQEKSLRDFYKRVLQLSAGEEALRGSFYEIHSYNRMHTQGYYQMAFSFARWSMNRKLIIVVNFKDDITDRYTLQLPAELTKIWQLADGNYSMRDLLFNQRTFQLAVKDGLGTIEMEVLPLESLVLSIESIQ